MYIPVLHARRCEKAAIVKIKTKIGDGSAICPLFIPVRDKKKGAGNGLGAVQEVVRKMVKEKIPYFLLTTPYDPKISYGQAEILKVLAESDKAKLAVPAIAVTKAKPLASLKKEILALKSVPFVVLHQSEPELDDEVQALLDQSKDNIQWHIFYSDGCSDAYMKRWKGSSRAIVEDGFVKRERNVEYPTTADEDYSSLFATYQSKGFKGFGDHTICGEDYKPGGGPALYVALHLTCPDPIASKTYTSVKIRHFVSSTSTATGHIRVVFRDALNQLLAFYKKYPAAFAFSNALKEMADPSKNWGSVLVEGKIMTIQHHLELMKHLDS